MPPMAQPLSKASGVPSGRNITQVAALLLGSVKLEPVPNAPPPLSLGAARIARGERGNVFSGETGNE